MLAKLQRFVWWPNMKESVHLYTAACITCQLNKPPSRDLAGFYQPQLPSPTGFLEIHVDLITSLPPARGLDCILTLVD